MDLLTTGGWLLAPIVGCSLVSLAICLERLWALTSKKIIPPGLFNQFVSDLQQSRLDDKKLAQIQQASPLGKILVAGFTDSKKGRDVMLASINRAASHAVNELERFLNALGTIAAIAPLLGLLGTVLGMIKVFNEIVTAGTGDPSVLAGGISEALITTAGGLVVAIPALVMHRFYNRRIDNFLVELEEESMKLVDYFYGDTSSQENSQAVEATIKKQAKESANEF